MLGFFGSARDGFTRPLAIGLTTLGLAGLLVGDRPLDHRSGGAATLSTVGAAIPNGAAGAAPRPRGGGVRGAASMEAATGSDRVAAQAEPDATKLDQDGTFSGTAELDSSASGDVAGDAGSRSGVTHPACRSLFVVAGVMLLVGLGLFAAPLERAPPRR